MPTRYVLSFLMFWGMSLQFAHRVCLNVTIVAMVNHTALNPPNSLEQNDTEEEVCPFSSEFNNTALAQQGEYVWSPSVQGVVLGAYYYGFVCTQMLGGRLAELTGGKWPLGLSIFLASLLTLVTPWAADIGVVAVIGLRALMGLIHGICLPTAFAMFSHWAPVEERSTLLAMCLIGDQVGTVVSMPLAGYLCDYGFAGGWPSVFYVLGTVGCIWFLFWSCLVYNKPTDHPRISKKELEYIRRGHIQICDSQELPVPWTRILTSMSIWSIAIVTFSATWGYTMLLTKLPTYLELVLHIPIQKNGLVNSLIYVCSCISLFFSGYISDYLRTRKKMSATAVRKGFQIVAMGGPAVCTALIPFVGCDKKLAIALLTLAMAFLGLCGGGHASITADMAPHHAATIFGLVNGIGCTAGIFSPLVAGLLLDSAHASIEQWSLVFYISTGFYIFGGLVFLIWASGEIQPWALIPCDNKRLGLLTNDKQTIYIDYKQLDLGESFTYGTIRR